MSNYLTAIITKLEKDTEWFVTNCPELGVVSQGRTIEEAFTNLQNAAKLFADEVEANDRTVNLSSVIVKKFYLIVEEEIL